MGTSWDMFKDVFTHINMTLLVTIFVIGIIGNVISLFIFIRESRKRKISHFHLLLAYLAGVDLLSALFLPGLLIYMTAVNWSQWHFGDFGCKVLRSLPPVFITLSQSILMLISYQRYRAVSKPLEPPIDKRFINIWVSVSLLIAILLVIPWTMTLKILKNPVAGLSTCTTTSQSNSRTGFILNYVFDVVMLGRDLFSCTFILTCSQLTIRSLQKNLKFYSTQYHLVKKMNNAKKLLNSITIVYCVCAIPIDVFHVIYFTMRAANYKFSAEEYPYLIITLTFLKTLQAAECSINPLLYSRRIREFKKFLGIKSKKHVQQALVLTMAPIAFMTNRTIEDTEGI